eukprot:760028-Hanusia_phi.AAC.1
MSEVGYTRKDTPVDWDKVRRAYQLVEQAFDKDPLNVMVLNSSRKLVQFYPYLLHISLFAVEFSCDGLICSLPQVRWSISDEDQLVCNDLVRLFRLCQLVLEARQVETLSLVRREEEEKEQMQAEVERMREEQKGMREELRGFEEAWSMVMGASDVVELAVGRMHESLSVVQLHVHQVRRSGGGRGRERRRRGWEVGGEEVEGERGGAVRGGRRRGRRARAEEKVKGGRTEEGGKRLGGGGRELGKGRGGEVLGCGSDIWLQKNSMEKEMRRGCRKSGEEVVEMLQQLTNELHTLAQTLVVQAEEEEGKRVSRNTSEKRLEHAEKQVDELEQRLKDQEAMEAARMEGLEVEKRQLRDQIARLEEEVQTHRQLMRELEERRETKESLEREVGELRALREEEERKVEALQVEALHTRASIEELRT